MLTRKYSLTYAGISKRVAVKFHCYFVYALCAQLVGVKFALLCLFACSNNMPGLRRSSRLFSSGGSSVKVR